MAAGPPTPIVVSGTAAGAGETGTVPTTLLGNGYVSAHLGAAGSGETNFVGGFGPTTSVRRSGREHSDLSRHRRRRRYIISLRSGEGRDRSQPHRRRHPHAGVQNFTFIGSAPFSGGAEVRYQLNPTNDTTTVQAALAGDPVADFSITLAGLRPLTAANFALTPAQSSAALANGAALTYTQVHDGRRRADRIRVFQRPGDGLHFVRIVLRLNLRRPCGGRSEPEFERKQARPLRPQSDGHEGRRQRILAGGNGQRSARLPCRRDHRREHQQRRAVHL